MRTGKDLQAWEKLDETFNSRVNRRRLLQLIGYGTAGIVGAEILAACGGNNPSPPPPVNTTSTPATAVTATAGTPRQIPAYFLGYNNVPIHSPSWDNPDVVQAAAQMKPGTLRYPGGTVANYWDWQSGWFLPGAPGSFKNAPQSIYRLQELQTAVNATGAIPIYVLNMLTSDLNTQLAMLRTAKSMGLPVKFVELGNEFYLNTPDDYVKKFPTGADYGTLATTWISAIRAEFPDVKIAAVGGVPVSGFSGNSRKGNWNNALLQHLHGADALTLHPYVPLGDNTVTNGASTVGPQLNTIASQKWQQFENQMQAVPSNMTFWITEYNFVDSSKQVFYHWIDGIFAAWMSLNFLTEERVELACYYDMIGQTGNEVIYYSRQGQGNSSNPGLSQFALTAAGWAMRLLGNTISGMTSATPITFDGNPSAIVGWIFSNGNRQQAFIINSGSDSFACSVSSILPQAKSYRQLTGDPLTIVTGPGSLTATNGSLSGPLNLPAYSVTQIQ